MLYENLVSNCYIPREHPSVLITYLLHQHPPPTMDTELPPAPCYHKCCYDVHLYGP